jgi:CubicO group peptidase (beta-lactamase class C family)
VAAPPLAPDPSAPSTILYQVLGELDALGSGRDTSRFRTEQHLARAHRAIVEALARYGTSPRPEDTIKALSKAARALKVAGTTPRGGPDATITRLSGELARAGLGIADALATLARQAGVPSDLVAEVESEIAAGVAASLSGQYVLAFSHFGAATSLTTSSLTFDIDDFEQNIIDALDGQTIGHAYAISLGGILYSAQPFGDARTPSDGDIAQSPAKEMYTASMSKTLSAVGLLKALDEAGVAVDAGISASLPSGWAQGNNVDDITFRHLLTHRSGLNPGQVNAGNLTGQNLQSLETFIAQGTPGILPFGAAVYTNANFALMRVLIPLLTTGEDLIDIYSNVLPEDEVYAALYAEYIRDEVLAPAGVNTPLCSPAEDASNRTLGYLFPNTSDGLDFGDWSLGCGATGWYLSALELGSFMAFLRYTNDIVSFDTRVLMDTGSLGWLNPVTFASFVTGTFGVYRGHGGDSASGAVKGMSGCMMKFPTAVEATLVINSRGGNIGGHACQVLRNAYDNAWTAP